MNKIILTGARVGQKPETKTFDNGNKICVLNVATKESWKDSNGDKQERSDWHRLQFAGKLVDTIKKYVNIGDEIHVEGKMRYNTYDKNGEKRTIAYVEVINFEFGRKAPNNNDNNSNNRQQKKTATDELPF